MRAIRHRNEEHRPTPTFSCRAGRIELQALEVWPLAVCCVYATAVVDAAVLVRVAREQAHMSARDLAAASGVSPSTVTRIERGEVNPTVAMLERLLDASGCRLEVLVSPREILPSLDALRHFRD